MITKKQANKYYQDYLNKLGLTQKDANQIGKFILHPSNEGIKLHHFKYQLTNWYELKELDNLINNFRKSDYGEHYVIKRNISNRLYAVFTKGKARFEKSPKTVQVKEPYYYTILAKKKYMMKHLPKSKSLQAMSQCYIGT